MTSGAGRELSYWPSAHWDTGADAGRREAQSTGWVFKHDSEFYDLLMDVPTADSACVSVHSFIDRPPRCRGSAQCRCHEYKSVRSLTLCTPWPDWGGGHVWVPLGVNVSSHKSAWVPVALWWWRGTGPSGDPRTASHEVRPLVVMLDKDSESGSVRLRHWVRRGGAAVTGRCKTCRPNGKTLCPWCRVSTFF